MREGPTAANLLSLWLIDPSNAIWPPMPYSARISESWYLPQLPKNPKYKTSELVAKCLSLWLIDPSTAIWPPMPYSESISESLIGKSVAGICLNCLIQNIKHAIDLKYKIHHQSTPSTPSLKPNLAYVKLRCFVNREFPPQILQLLAKNFLALI